jgi:hypothetical protein
MGLIRSQTDYVVYEAEGMAGLDLAFYRKRSRYHTKYDSVSQLGSKMPLWAMMENSLAATWALANDLSDENSTKDTVYFDCRSFSFVSIRTHDLTYVLQCSANQWPYSSRAPSSYSIFSY